MTCCVCRTWQCATRRSATVESMSAARCGPPRRSQVSRDRAFVVPLRPSKIAVTSALHDCLRDGEPHVGTKTFRIEKLCISAAGQQESEFGCTNLLIELGIATFGDVQSDRIRCDIEHLVFQGISSREHLEG